MGSCTSLAVKNWINHFEKTHNTWYRRKARGLGTDGKALASPTRHTTAENLLRRAKTGRVNLNLASGLDSLKAGSDWWHCSTGETKCIQEEEEEKVCRLRALHLSLTHLGTPSYLNLSLLLPPLLATSFVSDCPLHFFSPIPRAFILIFCVYVFSFETAGGSARKRRESRKDSVSATFFFFSQQLTALITIITATKINIFKKCWFRRNKLQRPNIFSNPFFFLIPKSHPVLNKTSRFSLFLLAKIRLFDG